MNDNISIIDCFISKLRSKLTEQLTRDENGELRLIDPNDHIEISAHYGATHLAAALLLLGKDYGDAEALRTGNELLQGILNRWSVEHTLPAYHYDFNNFAFIICFDCLGDEDTKLKDTIKKIVIKSPDSNHNTVNWLPMRAYVNSKRYEWTGDGKYRKAIERCQKLIVEATNNDGGIEDRLPKGVSFNLQYDISTLAALIFAADIFHEYDFKPGINFLLRNVAPDGDINYQGRGCNQIFAWGPWIFILSVYGLCDELEKALGFLSPQVDKMLDNKSMMLNNWVGSEKYLWWDYHYASVYTAHFLLWLLLAKRNFKKWLFESSGNNCSDDSSNLQVYKSEDYYVSVFGGRKEYLAEHGPTISLIWSKKYGNIVKGCFGPWRGLFGNRNTFEDIVMLNYCGLIKVNRKNNSGIIAKVIKRIRPLNNTKNSQDKAPYFSSIQVVVENKVLTITWYNRDNNICYFNLPCLCDPSCFKLTIDGTEFPLYNIAKIRNQYDLVNIIQSKASKGKNWTLTII